MSPSMLANTILQTGGTNSKIYREIEKGMPQTQSKTVNTGEVFKGFNNNAQSIWNPSKQSSSSNMMSSSNVNKILGIGVINKNRINF
jgi:hypothetical protein